MPYVSGIGMCSFQLYSLLILAEGTSVFDGTVHRVARTIYIPRSPFALDVELLM